MADLSKEWEPVIGLEIHTELNTKSKLFSVAPNRFGDEPNTNITEVCTGQPGALPVLNKEVVRKAVLFGCAVGAKVAHFSKFDRKSYFYPDSPRNFQITQLEQPIVLGGKIVTDVGTEEKEFAIDRAHIEDDAGMLKHFSRFAGVDYNRAGVPLIEVVSEACMHSPQEASAYARAVRAILQYLDVSDCNMEEGSLRFDANISVRKRGETGLRPKIEIKNMNSFTYMELAVTAEIKRQIGEYLANPDKPFEEVIQQATYRWDPDLKKTVLMRTKEDAEDYRYCPEPDLPPIILEPEYIESIRKTLPELPRQRKIRYKSEFDLKEEQAFLLTSDKALADYFEAGMKGCSNARSLCNWITVEFAGRFRDSGQDVWDSEIGAIHVAHLVKMIEDKTITGKIAKKVADDMVASPGKDPRKIVAANPDYQPVHDEGELLKYVEQVLTENPDAITDFKAGKDRAFKYLMGQVMKLSRGKASPQHVTELLKKRLEA